MSEPRDPARRVPTRAVAAFDFDGTLSKRDTLLPFVAGLCGRARTARALAGVGPRLAAAAVGAGDRGAVKERFLGRLLAGRDGRDVRAAGERFAGELLGAEALRPDSLGRVEWHRAQDHELVIVSASLAVYLEPLGERLGFTAVVATRLEEGADGRLTGRLLGLNVRGPEKAARLQEWLAASGAGDGRGRVELWAYGDSSGDDEMLALAAHPHRV